MGNKQIQEQRMKGYSTQLIVSSPDRFCDEDWKTIEPNNDVRDLRKRELNYTITGMLLFI
jgi:hypothetical protein